jgi:hypothetical protein
MRTALFWDITQRVLVVPYRRFGTTYQSHLQDSWHLRMEPVGCPETSVRNYHHSLRSNLEDRNSRVLRFFPRVKSTGAWCWSHLHLALSLRIRSVLPPLPPPRMPSLCGRGQIYIFRNLFTVFFLAIFTLCLYELCMFNGLRATLDVHRCACVFTDR